MSLAFWYLCPPMKQAIEKLNELRLELMEITKNVQKGVLLPDQAADRIVHVRQEMEEVIQKLKDLTKNAKN